MKCELINKLQSVQFDSWSNNSKHEQIFSFHCDPAIETSRKLDCQKCQSHQEFGH